MVVIITGASCTGKTMLTKRLTDTCGVKQIAMDSIKMDLFRNDKNCGFTPTDSNRFIGGKIWSVIKKEILNAIDNGTDLIIEGAYFFPDYLEEIPKKYLKFLYPVYICFSPEYISKQYDSGIIKHRHIAKIREYEEDRAPEVFIKDHNTLREKCLEYGAPFYFIESDYEKEIDKIYEAIVGVF